MSRSHLYGCYIYFNRNAMDYDAVACAAAEGHDDILHYLLSLGESPNGNDKVIGMYSTHHY